MRLVLTCKCVAIMVIGLVVSGGARGGDTSAVGKASRTIQRHDKLIAFFAHPTGKLQSVSYEQHSATGSGFELTYKFSYSHTFGNFNSRVAFRFDQDGAYQSATPVSSTGLTTPFSSADLVLDLIRDDLLQDPEFKDNRVVRDLIQRGDAKGLLTFLIRTAR